MNRYITITKLATVALIAASVLFSCKKAEQYYEKLDAQPEVNAVYGSVYGVGDTLTLEGRLNPENNLEIRIGGVKADIAAITKNPSRVNNTLTDTLETAKIVITVEMGVGPDRPITITSGGNTIQSRSIEIIESSKMGYLSGEVKWQRVATLSNGAIPLFCLNGKGTVFFWLGANTVTRIAKDGTSTQVFNGGTLSDEYGSFTVSTFNAGGIDPTERYFYFSALTADGNADNQNNTIYRFCKVDLQSGKLTTLNRSALPKTDNQRTLSSIQPFEGNIKTVKVFQATGIYPDSEGNVYVQLAQHIMAKLTLGDSFRYLLNFKNTYTAFPARIWDNNTGDYINPQVVVNLLPGVKTREWLVSQLAISPDEGLLYGRLITTTVGISLYDMNAQAEIYTNNFTYWNPVTSVNEPYISGTFGVLTLPSQSANLALPSKRLLNFYTGNAPATMGLLNFNLKRGERYAPGGAATGIYTLSAGTDQWLNYDEEGMIYSTANSKSMIIKTQYK